MEGVPVDLQTKYQKLAAEYSKIRAQAAVLKKAVIEEQSRNAELKDVLKERDQSLRKADQEMDSLNFRNQQLTKRVTILQDELAEHQAKSKKGKGKSSGAPLQTPEYTNNVIDEEFQKKIAENAELLSLMHEKDITYQLQVSEMTEKLEQLQHEVQKFKKCNNDAEESYKAVIESLQSDKVKMEARLSAKEKEVQQTCSQVYALEQRLKETEEGLKQKLEAANDIISNHIPFVDRRINELNELNVPHLDRRRQAWCLHLVAQVGSHVRDLATGLSDFHTYTEQRVAATSDCPSPLNAKFSTLLKDNARYLRALEQGYRDFQEGLESDIIVTLETVPSIQKFSRALSSYVTYLQKLLPYHKLSIEEDCKNYACEDSLKMKNMEIREQLSTFTTLFAKLNTYVGLLSMQSKRSYQHPKSSQKRFLLELSDVFTSLHLCAKDLSKMYCLKARLERDLPQVTEKAKTTDECLVNSLLAIVTCTGKLSEIISDSKAQLLKDSSVVKGEERKLMSGSVGSNPHPLVGDFKKRAACYLSALNQEGEQESVPYEEALWAREEARSGVAGRVALQQQLEGSQQRATRLEQEVEHWRLEFQLLQLKYSKEIQKSQEGKDQCPDAEQRDNSVKMQNAAPKETANETVIPDSNNVSSPVITTNMLGKLEQAMEIPEEVYAREKEVKDYFIQRINLLVADRQISESKALTLHSELTMLHKRLELCHENKVELESTKEKMADHLKELQEELQTTTQNYESQLSMMSEHLANMNEKLTIQKDKIDELTYQLNNKTSRKGKLK
ncbi:protein phosphatase 1 regulatory subunit 21 [Ischnura elegans]|uniref:protein phosphatase 1 regulatory subunit 21 n=1 Tax=Ischnura elegans TaxID=197161 RepID=UPI001ED8A91A|nr:protein phosphatase 1 regulatory subunit 21 [Ischnura elegans]